MKKIIVAALLLGATCPAFAQAYKTSTAKINFDATSPKSPEDIKAVNNEVSCALTPTGDFVFMLGVKSFKFKNDLMQQHFNENYMESEKFPKSTFKGKVVNIADANLAKDGTYNVKVAGDLTIHGVTKNVSVPGTLTVKGNTVMAKAVFKAILADYKIDIPSVVSDKLAKEASIVIDAVMTKK